MENTSTSYHVSNNPTKVLKIENLVSGLKRSNTFLPIVENCSFHIKAGRTLGIVGESGSGKSFLALSLMRLLPENSCKTNGKIFLDNQDILTLPETEMQKIRGKNMAMIFQEPMTSLNPVYTVGHQIAETFLLHTNASKKDAYNLAFEMLKKVHISSPEKRMNEYPHQLSGGMRQRIMIAMALACKPKLLIADEPTTALDVTIQAQILALMNELQKEQEMAIMLITHDLGVVAETCDDVAIMYAGKIVELASTKELFENPKHPYTKGLLASSPRIGEKKKRLYSISGMVPNLSNLPVGCRFQDRCPLVSDECKKSEPEFVGVSRKFACFQAKEG